MGNKFMLKLSSNVRGNGEYVARRDKIRTRYERIYDLPYYKEVYDKLRKGWSLTRVAKMIQSRGGCSDISFSYLRQTLHFFRNERIPKTEILKDYVPEYVMDTKEKFKESIDELEEIEDLYRVQRDRIGVDYKKEKQIGKLFNNTYKEMEVCLAMLQASAKLKQDLGLTKKELGTLNVEGRHILEAQNKYGTKDIQDVITNPNSRRRVLMLAERILASNGSIDEDVSNLIEKEDENNDSDDIVSAEQDIE